MFIRRKAKKSKFVGRSTYFYNFKACLNSSVVLGVVGVFCKKIYWKWGTVAISYTLYLNANYSKIGIFEI